MCVAKRTNTSANAHRYEKLAPDTLKANNELDPDFVKTLHDPDKFMTVGGSIDRKNKRLMRCPAYAYGCARAATIFRRRQ